MQLIFNIITAATYNEIEVCNELDSFAQSLSHTILYTQIPHNKAEEIPCAHKKNFPIYTSVG